MKKYTPIAFLCLLCSCSLHVEQDMESCGDESHFRITTWATKFGTRNAKYYNSTGCLTSEQVDSTKKAETFIKNYKKVTK